MIKIKCNLLMFDKPDLLGRIYPKNCKIDIPRAIPITRTNHTEAIGWVTKIEHDYTSIRIEGEIEYPDEKAIREALSAHELYASVCYSDIDICAPTENPIQVIKSMKLCSVKLVPNDVYGDHSLLLEEV